MLRALTGWQWEDGLHGLLLPAVVAALQGKVGHMQLQVGRAAGSNWRPLALLCGGQLRNLGTCLLNSMHAGTSCSAAGASALMLCAGAVPGAAGTALVMVLVSCVTAPMCSWFKSQVPMLACITVWVPAAAAAAAGSHGGGSVPRKAALLRC